MFYFYFKSYNKLYEDIFFAKDLSSGKIFRFLDIVQIQGKNDTVKVLWKTLKLHKGVEKQFQFEVINFQSFAWIFNTRNIQNESTYTEFLRKHKMHSCRTI